MSALRWNAVRDERGITVRHQWNAQEYEMFGKNYQKELAKIQVLEYEKKAKAAAAQAASEKRQAKAAARQVRAER